MPQSFNLTAQLQLQGPTNVAQVRRRIQAAVSGITATVNIAVPQNTISSLRRTNQALNQVSTTLRTVASNAQAATSSLNALGASLSRTLSISNRQAANSVKNITHHTAQAKTEMQEFGRVSALAVRRFVAFSIPAGILIGMVTAIKKGVSAAIEFDREMVRIQQVTNKTQIGIASLGSEIGRLASTFGVSSAQLALAARTLSQAGLSAKQVKISMEALAKSDLSPTFDNIVETTEGAIAAMSQFRLEAKNLESTLSSINSVSAAFAVESSDIISAIRRTGGAFESAGGSLNELMALFTSVRATTRESADSIATGFRTIFTRLQRPRTIKFLEEFNVQLQDMQGKFVGPYEAVRRLNEALSKLDPRDVRFAQIIEELGGFRQVSKVIPLIQQFALAQKALSVAQAGTNSLAEDAAIAQNALAVQLTKVTEKWQILFRDIVSSDAFQNIASSALTFASALADIVRGLKDVLPLLTAIAGIKLASAGLQFATGFPLGLFPRTIKKNKGGGVHQFAGGGLVPGQGNRDTVPAMLSPGEFVIRKKSVEQLGASNLANVNRYAKAGPVKPNQANVLHELPRKFGVIALLPHGKAPMNTDAPVNFTDIRNRVLKLRPDLNKLPVTEANKYIHGGMGTTSSVINANILGESFNDPELARTVNKKVIESSSVLAQNIGGDLAKQLGTGLVPTNIKNIISKNAVRTIAGHVFEGGIASLGVPFDRHDSGLEPIDFPKGLTAGFSSKFPNLVGIPTDAKRTLDTKNINSVKTKKIPNFLAQLVSSNIPGVAATPKPVIRNQPKQPKSARRQEFMANLLKPKAKGGPAGTDTVSALLTPGEFVINKESAQRIGRDNLNAMNKYAAGGPVAPGGGIGTGAGSSIMSILIIQSLLSSFTDMDSTVGKLSSKLGSFLITVEGVRLAMSTMAGIGASISGKSILQDRTLAGQAALENFRTARTGQQTFGPLPPGVTRTNRMPLAPQLPQLPGPILPGPAAGQTIAPISKMKAFGAGLDNASVAMTGLNASVLGVTAAAATLSAVLLKFSGKFGKEGTELAKSARTPEELARAENKFANKSALSGAGIGVGGGAAVGALVGTSIVPVLGTAVGAALGAAIGGGAGGLIGGAVADTSEAGRLNRESRFEEAADKMTSAMEELTTGRAAPGGSELANVGAQLREQRRVIQETRKVGETDNVLQRERSLKGQIPQFEQIRQALQQTVTSLDAFKKAGDNAGEVLIQTIAAARGLTQEQVESEIDKEIQGRVKLNAALIAGQAAQRQFLSSITILQRFNGMLSLLTNTIDNMAANISTRAQLMGGDVSVGGFRGRPGFGNFGAAATGGIADMGVFRGALQQVLGGLGPAGAGVKQEATGLATDIARLPDLLAKTFTGKSDFDNIDIETAMEDMLKDARIGNKLGGIILDNLGKMFKEAGSGTAEFNQGISTDPTALVQKLIGDFPKELFGQIEEIAKKISDASNTYLKAVEEQAKQGVRISQQVQNNARTQVNQRRELFQLRNPNTRMNMGTLLREEENLRARSVSGLNVNAGDPASIANRLKEVNEEIVRTQQSIQSGAPEDAAAAGGKLKGLNIAADQLRRALEDLADSGNRAKIIQDELSNLEESRKAKFGLAERFTFGSNDERRKILQSVDLATQVGRGRSIDTVPGEMRGMVQQIFKEFENVNTLGFGKGRDALNRTVGGKFTPMLGAETTGTFVGDRNQAELAVIGQLQEEFKRSGEARDAQIEVLDKNYQAMTAQLSVDFKAFGDGLIAELRNSVISQAQSQASGAQAGLANTTANLENRNKALGFLSSKANSAGIADIGAPQVQSTLANIANSIKPEDVERLRSFASGIAGANIGTEGVGQLQNNFAFTKGNVGNKQNALNTLEKTLPDIFAKDAGIKQILPKLQAPEQFMQSVIDDFMKTGFNAKEQDAGLGSINKSISRQLEVIFKDMHTKIIDEALPSNLEGNKRYRGFTESVVNQPRLEQLQKDLGTTSTADLMKKTDEYRQTLNEASTRILQASETFASTSGTIGGEFTHVVTVNINGLTGEPGFVAELEKYVTQISQKAVGKQLGAYEQKQENRRA